jgi:2',3'-cyclic-nucleotide 2'-phosphodiesterase (5'-nucleotidase family)
MDDVGGMARCATIIRKWRRENPDSLLLDIGDVYQGTAVGHATRGNLMMKIFNRLGYDAWTPGNHDFDWGPECLRENLALSKPAVLAANLTAGGKSMGRADGDWKSVRPWVMRHVGGFRIALIGLVTPGLPYWLAPETLGDVEVRHPLESLRRSIAEARADKADAIVVMAHMGWRVADDFANPLRELLKEAPGVDVLLAGHTHQDEPSWDFAGVLCSQASYHGIHCGRMDLIFDPDSRRLVGREAMTQLMDTTYELDPAVMEAAGPDLAMSAASMTRKLGRVTREIRGAGRDNELVRLFCECFSEALSRNGTPVDGVFHGTFGSGNLPRGEITVGDCWSLLPYENLLMTAVLTAEDLIEVVREERLRGKSDRILWPFEITLNRAGEVTRFEHRGKPVAPKSEFTIAFNSYDGQSAGQSLMRLRGILSQPAAKRKVTVIDTRGALIDGILNRGEIP